MASRNTRFFVAAGACTDRVHDRESAEYGVVHLCSNGLAVVGAETAPADVADVLVCEEAELDATLAALWRIREIRPGAAVAGRVHDLL